MQIGKDGIALIKRWESYRGAPYLCPAGWWTVGYGAVKGPEGLPVTKQTPPISRAQAELMLMRDTRIAAAAVNRLCPVSLTQQEFDALCSFAFNLGGGALQRSTLRQCVLREDHAAAEAEFPKWCKARDPRTGMYRALPGLMARRVQEASLYAGYTLTRTHPAQAA